MQGASRNLLIKNAIVRDSKRNKKRKSTGVKAPKHARPAKRGFALVITISLMILLVLIGVGMLTLSSITLRTASQESAMATARANARMALMLAIGDLQRNAGPDQFVTARAEILDASPSGNIVSGVTQPYWTGTWPTGEAGLDVAHAGNAGPQRATSFKAPTGGTDRIRSAHWLVSDPNPANTTSHPRYIPTTGFTPVTLGAGNSASRNAVKMATNQGPSTNPMALKDVSVPLVKIMDPKASTTNPTGGFAYWVADEGVKAKVNLVDPTIGQSSLTTTGQAHFLAPQANAFKKFINTKETLVQSGQDLNLRKDTTDLNKTVSYKSVGLLPAITAGVELRCFMPDVTTESRGVIADVKHGGLKKDLTAAFENVSSSSFGRAYDDLTTNYGYDGKCVYRNHPLLTTPYPGAISGGYEGVTDGLPWSALYAYYNTYKYQMSPPTGVTYNSPYYASTMAAPSSQGMGSLANLPNTISTRFLVINNSVSNGYGYYGGLVPELLSQRMDIALDSYTLFQTDGSTVYRLRLNYMPQIVLYNPYNCVLNCPGGFYFCRRYHLGNGTDYTISVSVDGKQVSTGVVLNQETAWYGNNFDMMTDGWNWLTTLQPGETRVFGIDHDQDFTSNLPDTGPRAGEFLSGPQQAVNCDGLVSSPGLSPDYAHRCDLPTGTIIPDTNSNHFDFQDTGVYAGTPNGTDTVMVTFSHPGELRCSGGETFFENDVKWPASNTGGQRNFIVDGPNGSYNPLPGWPTNLRIEQMTGNNKYVLAGFFLRTKGINTTTSSASAVNYVNGTTNDVIPIFHGNAPYFSPFESLESPSRHEMFINKFGQQYNSSARELRLGPHNGNGFETYFGMNSVGVPESSPGIAPIRRVLRDVPNQPLISIGQFMHIPTLVHADGGSGFGDRDVGSMFVGGSMCSPVIATTNNILPSTNYLLLDDSYLANDTLFDRFFFSTVPPATLDKATPSGTQWDAFNQANTNSSSTLATNSPPLPNSRIKPFGRNGSLPLLSDLRDFNKAAANLMLDGAFNVNSTSVNAWMAFLSSLSGNDLQIYDSALKSSSSVPSSRLVNFIPRFWSGGTSNVGLAWGAGCALQAADIQTLATQIVQQVKTRGPFLSMADFLNRRLGGNNSLTRVGCLQAAIDNTSINSGIKAIGTAVSSTDAGMPTSYQALPTIIKGNMADGAGSTLSSAFGMPGYLMQQDIVQAFSPAMTVRSDTFVVRAYGECVNPLTGDIQAKAWAEAVVQRVPEFVDSSADPDPSAAVPKDPSGANNVISTNVVTRLTSNVNITLGRRFKVSGFRWLSQNEL